MRIFLLATQGFEAWDWRNPAERGIGGSETQFVETAWRLARRGHHVTCYAPIPADCPREWRGTIWRHHSEADFAAPGLWLVHRNPGAADRFGGRTDQRLWAVSQDVVYTEACGGEWTPERAAKFERIFALCPVHQDYLARAYPFLSERLCLWSNGIKTDEIAALPELERNPKRLVWASSPDRGLEALLHIFRRAREYDPDLELRVAYGFDNWNRVIDGHNARRKQLKRQRKPDPGPCPQEGMRDGILRLMDQPGVTWLGRIGQPELHREFLQAGLWCYPSTFTETSPLHGDTLIETLEGRVKIRDLVGKENFPVYSCDAEGKLSLSTVRWVACTRRNTQVIRLALRPGSGRNAKQEKTLVLTPDHEVMLRDGTYRAAGELRPGDRVKAFHRRKDGWGVGYDLIGLTDQAVVPERQFVAARTAGRALRPGEVVDHLDGNTRHNLPGNLEIRVSQAEHMQAHKQRMSLEESQVNGQRKSVGVRKFQDELDPVALKELRGRGARAMWDRLAQCSVEERQAFLKRRAAARCGNHIVTAVEEAGTADVFCMEVDPDHNFVANGIVVHNCIACMEAQALGAIPLTNHLWATAENVRHGIKILGDPLGDPLARARYVTALVRLTNDAALQEQIRGPMMSWARETFDWERQVDKIEAYAAEDLSLPRREAALCS